MDKYIAIGRVRFDGDLFEAGDEVDFEPGDERFVKELLDLGVIQPAAEGDMLASLTLAKLRELAEAEHIELPAKAKEADIRKALLTARAERAAAAIAADPDGQQTK